MAIAFRAVGTAVGTETTTCALVAPTVVTGDVMFACIISRNNTAVVAPAGWGLIYDTANTAAMQTYLGWKRANSADSGATFNFTVAGTTSSLGVIIAYSGVRDSGRPYNGSSISSNASADNVTFATLSPAGPGMTVAFGTYGEDLTNAATFSGTDPTFTERSDDEFDGTTTDQSIFIWDGPHSGIPTGARTLASNSTTDAVNQGILLDLVPMVEGGGASGEAGVLYPRRVRVGDR